MKRHISYANALSTGNLASGFLALLAVPTNRVLALLLVLIAGAFDSVDGVVARRGSADHTFGAGLDSLADVVSFGVVPALALYYGLLVAVPVLGPLACLGFLGAGAWRLARFPLVKDAHSFVGLPLPPAGLLLVLLSLAQPVPLLALAVTVGLSALMVSEVPFPTLAALTRSAGSSRGRPHRPAWVPGRRRG